MMQFSHQWWRLKIKNIQGNNLKKWLLVMVIIIFIFRKRHRLTL